MTGSNREQLRKMMHETEVTVVEVLSEDRYADFHLPGAINVPLEEGFEQQIEQALPDKTEPVVIYCYDADCTASPKAAERIEALGYRRVYDYEAGKMDWKQAGLPVEG